MDLELKGKVALITGGSGAIGRAIATELSREGATVMLCARGKEALDKAAREIATGTGGKAYALTADVTKRDSVDAMVKAVIADLGHVDILVNNAAIPNGLVPGPLETVDDELMWQDLNTKYMGYLRCARAVAPSMRQSGWGRMIHIGGLSARMSGSYSGGARNIALVHLSKTLSDELGQYGITSNLIHPGAVRTHVREEQARRDGYDIDAKMGASSAMRRVVRPEEIAHVVAFLASPKAISITGVVIETAGGASRAITM